MAAASPRVWAAVSKDYDSLLFGAPRLVRFLTVGGREFLPSQGTFRPIVPETLDLGALLADWEIDREGLIDLAILVGTDFNRGIKGVGPKSALKMVQRFGRIDSMAEEIQEALGGLDLVNDVRRIFLQPEVTDVFDLAPAKPDRDGIVSFLCEEREFSRPRVLAALDRAFREPTLW
jgi:flap endonuclease-1